MMDILRPALLGSLLLALGQGWPAAAARAQSDDFLAALRQARPAPLFPQLWGTPLPEAEVPDPAEPPTGPSRRPPEPPEPPADAEMPRMVGWQMEEVLPLPLPGQVLVFGRVGAGPGAPRGPDLRLTGRTGLCWKLPALVGSEVLVRSGTTLNCTGLPMLEDSQLLVEVQCRRRLFGGAGLEYQGTAFPALGPAEQARLEQDLGVVIPLGQLGQLRVGTRHSWLNTPQPQPWLENLQLQLGSSLKW